jgi:uncharacterized membrane protein YhaH (DUF805 family)
MLNTYFGDVTSGRLQRLPFLGYFILLQIVILAIAIGIGVGLGVAENLVGGDLQQAQEMLRTRFGIPVMIMLAILFGTLLFAMLNLEAKRIRDMGLPGWWTLLAVLIFSVIITALLSGFLDPELGNRVSSIISAIAFLALVFIPSDTFSGNSR